MEIQFTNSFNKQFKKVPEKIRLKFRAKLEKFLSDEFDISLNNHKLSGEWTAFRSINISGDWRAIYYISDNSIRIFIAIGTHSQLYSK